MTLFTIDEGLFLSKTYPMHMHSEIPDFDYLVTLALDEDVGAGDATCRAIIPEEAKLTAHLAAREPCILCGLPVAAAVFKRLDPAAEVELLATDGDRVEAGASVLQVRGRASSVLTAERTALNFAQHLTGIATLTAKYVEAAANPALMVLDTRKTIPAYRLLEKYAVRCGGGRNHRMGLYDRIMVKDNHLALCRAEGAETLTDLVDLARNKYPSLEVEVEVDTLDQYQEVLAAEPDWILLDNMSCEQMIECVRLRDNRTRLEASGGITLETIGAVAQTGVDAVSVGALTHSAHAVDLALDYG